jgi:ribonuclease HI
MDTFYLFTDGSVNTTTKIGYGAYLVVSDLTTSIEIAKSRIKLNRFEDTSSSKLEIQTLLWALGIVEVSNKKLIIFTDSQNIIELPGRREKLEHNNYMTKTGNLLANHELYKSLFKLIDRHDYKLEKVKGHQKTANRNEIERLFTLVDRASRKALREKYSQK